MDYKECVERFLRNQRISYITGIITDRDFEETLEAFRGFVHKEESEENNVHQA